MILTVTLNPSVDMRFVVNEFARGGVYRSREDQQTAGGKGLNVTRVLKQLNAPVVATGLLGGANGDFIRQQLDADDIRHSFVNISGNTRACIAILEEGVQTEVLGKGPEITENELSNFYQDFDRLVQEAKLVTMSGSLPPTLPPDTYGHLIEIAHKSSCQVVLDSSGQALVNGLKARPLVVKPNQEELAAISSNAQAGEADVARAMQGLNAENVVVSLGKAGALAKWSDIYYRIRVPEIQAVNPVGSGDAMVAGLAWGLHEAWAPREILAFAAACGVANALEKQTGTINPETVDDLLTKIEVSELE